jgi:hypothetical protein
MNQDTNRNHSAADPNKTSEAGEMLFKQKRSTGCGKYRLGELKVGQARRIGVLDKLHSHRAYAACYTRNKKNQGQFGVRNDGAFVYIVCEA